MSGSVFDEAVQGPAFDPLPAPSVEVLSTAEVAARRAKKEAPVRFGFIGREHSDEPDPPLARILRGERGGRGGDVRLRLMLSLLWFVRDVPQLSFPARAWAELLGLPDPVSRGARRIKDALRWLDRHDFLRLETSPGRDSVIHLLEETGSKRPYELPGATYSRLKKDRVASAPHRYIRLPRELWTNGWISRLSGPAIAMLLVLWREAGTEADQDVHPQVWLSPSLADQRYALSEDTRYKGVRELQRAHLVEIFRKPISPDTFDYRRVRNVYKFDRSWLVEHKPGDSSLTFFRPLQLSKQRSPGGGRRSGGTAPTD